jgi:hypothetical protein
MAPLEIKLQALDGTWETVGVDRYPGVWAEGFQAASNEWGYDTCSFVLKRPTDVQHPDLSSFTPCEVYRGGSFIWDGRIKETPTTEGPDGQINVTGVGWQAHLDDDLYERIYVQSDMTAFRDQRDFLEADLRTFRPAPQVNVQGSLSLMWPQGTSVNTGEAIAATYDLGPYSTAARVSMTSAISSVNNVRQSIRGHDTTDPYGTGSEEILAYTPTTNPSPLWDQPGYVPGTYCSPQSATFSTPHRYVSCVLSFYGVPSVMGADAGVKFGQVIMFGDPAYESGGASVLKASQIIADAITTACPLLSPDRSQIQATSFSLPDFALDGPHTARDVITAANAIHRWRTRIKRGRVPEFAPLPNAPLVKVGAWGGSKFQDASVGSGEEIYSRVFVTGTGPDGADLIVDRSATPGTTLVDRRGFTRTKELQIGSALMTALANQLGDVFLATHARTPLKGSLDIQPGGLRSVATDEPIHPSELLNNTTELIRLSHLIDPDTGAVGRDGIIESVSYSEETETASVQLDNDRNSFEQLLQRMAVVVGSVRT